MMTPEEHQETLDGLVTDTLVVDAVVIGGGPAGLMAAERLLAAGLSVALFDAMPSVGRKFLLAGVGGMNITHVEPREAFYCRYYEAQASLSPCLDAFNADDLRQWVQALGIETFVGSSGKIFPAGMKAAPLLRAWLHRLRSAGLQLMTRSRWLGWTLEDVSGSGTLLFNRDGNHLKVNCRVTVLALGGASWPRLGSNGQWQTWLVGRGVALTPLQPANCGFNCAWSSHFTAAGAPVKSVLGWVQETDKNCAIRGELILTAKGIEGSLVYRLSATLRVQLLTQGKATLYLDLLPDKSEADIVAAFRKAPKGRNTSKVLSNNLGLCSAKKQLLFECTDSEGRCDVTNLAKSIKALPVTLHSMCPIEEAISCAGGVRFDAMTDGLMLKAVPGVFCAGEMIDWEAPTGGYLLTACFATGRWAGEHAAGFVKAQ